MRLYEKCFKRLLDILFSGIALIILSPILLVVAVLVRFKLGTPIIFRQKRPGKNEKIFNMYKFRTMTDETDYQGNLLSDDQRLTNFGKKLRSTSLDELPELWNIFKGDMSIVGPRPLLIQYLPLYNDFQKQRHDVRPGLTGLAQINGRNTISWSDKFKYDVDYTNKINFMKDIAIVYKTIVKVFNKEDINQEGNETVEYFKGNEE